MQIGTKFKKDLYFYKSSHLIFIDSKLREIPYCLANIILVTYKVILILIFFKKVYLYLTL